MSFSISIHKNPVFVWDERRQCETVNWDETQGDRVLDFDFYEFNELQNFLAIKLSPTKQCEDEDYGNYQERLKNECLKAAKEKGYEMLGRFWFWYDDAIYFSSEIIQLREECLKVKSNSQNSALITGMNKILNACDEALKTDSGIYFGCD